MNAAIAAVWLAARTEGAPAQLKERAAAFFAATPACGDLVARLSEAGGAALDAAIDGGADRAAALDLLAADALITLALLAAAEHNAATLGTTATALRLRASTAA
ncbi:MAG TPA: hypothetical protein VGL65_10875 [Gemmatimonadales bacterium]|jgi:hypothetical protein